MCTNTKKTVFRAAGLDSNQNSIIRLYTVLKKKEHLEHVVLCLVGIFTGTSVTLSVPEI